MRSLSLVALVAVLASSGCKKKAAQEPPPPAGSGSGSGSGSAQTVADAGASPPTGSGSAGSGSAGSGSAGSGSSATEYAADCALYGDVAARCGHGLGDAKAIANECLKALLKNTAMAPSMRIQINCAKADATCAVFDRCIAKP